MDKQKSLLNVTTSLLFKIITMGMSIVVKRLLIRICGNDVNGLNTLYLSIIGVLSIVELGLGSAIAFCMYKPIVEGDQDQVSALYGLFRRCYLAVGGIILLAGLLITPFIHTFAKDYAELDVNLYSTFVLMLISVVLTYLFSSKTSLINAHKNNYITTAVTSGGIVLQYILQITVLLVYRSFTGYLLCRIVAVCVQWGVTELITFRKYRHILSNRQQVSADTKKVLAKSIRAMFMHKIGNVLVNTADSLIISICIGVVALGEYSNYSVIMNSVIGILQMIFTSLTSVVGHLYVKEGRERTRAYCDAFHLLNFVIGSIFFLGYYAVIDDLVALLFGPDLVSERSVAFVVTLNGFVQYLRRSVLMFRDATGTFYNDRWKPLVEGSVNIILSVLLIKSIGVTGVILATIITNLLLCHVIEPYILYKYAFAVSAKEYYVRNLGYIAAFVITMGGVDACMICQKNNLQNLLVNGCISVVISTLLCGCTMLIVRRQTWDLLSMFGGRKGRANG